MESICIRPVGNVDNQMIEYLAEKLPKAFGRTVTVLEPIGITPQSYDIRRLQYLSDELLKAILSTAPIDALKILGITEVDLFIPIFTYVFGEAQLGGKAAIISLTRLKPEGYEDNPNGELYKLRMLKETIHELGHTFGLVHCAETGCVMNFANNIVEVDNKSYLFCSSCADLIKRS